METAVATTRVGRYRWTICGLLFLAATINYVDRQVIGILKPTLQAEFGWSEIDYGDIVFAFQFAYAIGFLFAGRIIDRLGTRKGFSLALIIWSLAAMATAEATRFGPGVAFVLGGFGLSYSSSVAGFMFVRFLLGHGESGKSPAAIKTVAEWFTRRERAFATGRFKAGTEDEVAIQEELNTYKGVHRIVRHAFEFARDRGLAKVCMADKSNAMLDGHALWQRVFRELSAQYSDITATHYYIDALAMYMVLDPGQFQVIVTNNLFGDIITDLGATFQGGLGMAASGNLHPGKTSMFEPVHGSAPKFAGKNIANPIGAIASVALMLETCGLADEAAAIDAAILKAVRERQITQDVGGTLGTREAGDFIASAVRSQK